MRINEVSPLLDTLTPEQVTAYLRRKGWRALDYPNSNLLVFEAPQDDDLSLVLPARRESSDYPAKLRDSIRLLSPLYDHDFQTIVHNIAHWDRDVFKIRLDSPGGEQLLPLDYATQMISMYRDFVAYLIIAEQPFGLDEHAHRVLKAVSEALQTVEEPDEDKIILGRITNLRSDMPPVHSEAFELATRTIVVLWEIEKQQPLKVHIALPLDQYRLACDAHKNGRKVRILGKPRKKGKFWTLFDHNDFEIV